jgi:hypothetical protein
MASTFHDDGKTRLYCSFEDNFESMMTQMLEGEVDEDTHFMDTTISSWSDTKTSSKYGKLFLCSSTNYFENRLLPNDLIIVRNYGEGEEDE